MSKAHKKENVEISNEMKIIKAQPYVKKLWKKISQAQTTETFWKLKRQGTFKAQKLKLKKRKNKNKQGLQIIWKCQ